MFSFNRRNKQLEVHKFVQRLVNLSSPNLPQIEGESRSEARYNRTIPMLLVPWENDKPAVKQSVYVVTRDISDHGLSLVLQSPFHSERVVCGFWLDHPNFVIGRVRQRAAFGGGFWHLGVEFDELTSPSEVPELEALVPLAQKLIRPELAPADTASV